MSWTLTSLSRPAATTPIELTDDAVTGGSRQTDGGDQRRHADHDAKHRQRHPGRTRDRPGDGLGDEVAHRDSWRRNARPGWRWQCRLASTKEPTILHVDPARAPTRNVFVVRDNDDRHALLVELGEEIQDRLGVRGIEIAGRLVAQQQARWPHQSAGDRHPLTFAAGQFRRQEIRTMLEADAANFLHRPLAPPAPGLPAVYFRQHDVLEDSAIGQQVEWLKDESNAAAP
jgi:hypothetical protein